MFKPARLQALLQFFMRSVILLQSCFMCRIQYISKKCHFRLENFFINSCWICKKTSLFEDLFNASFSKLSANPDLTKSQQKFCSFLRLAPRTFFNVFWRHYIETLYWNTFLLFTLVEFKSSFLIVYKKTDEWYIKWQRMTTFGTTSDNEWQRVTTNDNQWQRVIQRVIINDNGWQRVVQQMKTTESE